MKSKDSTSGSKLKYLRNGHYQRWHLVLVFPPKSSNSVNVFKFSIEIIKLKRTVFSLFFTNVYWFFFSLGLFCFFFQLKCSYVVVVVMVNKN